MKKIDNFVNLSVFFIGIGGISMSGLAKLMFSFGAKVSGSDTGKDNPEIAKLQDFGIKVYNIHDGDNIAESTDLVVYNFAIKDDNPEYVRAKRRGITILSRAELLGIIASKYEHVISVAGTHGKTTTTAMLGEIFVEAGLCPTVHLGGVSNNLKTNTLIGKNKYLILEACEYHGGFNFLRSDYGVILNIDADHLDYYKSMKEINGAFENFARKSKTIVLGETVPISHVSALKVGKDIVAKNIKYRNLDYDFDVYLNGKFWASVRLNIIGKHNITNALFAILVAINYGISKSRIVSALSKFKGVERRYETIANINSVPIIIDYAHHPTEIRASLDGVFEVAKKPLVIFQPHTYSRTLALFDDFVSVLGGVQNLILYPTYPAREKEIIGGRAEDLKSALNGARFVQDVDELENVINTCTKSKLCDIVLILGAGDLAEKLKTLFKSK